MLFQPSNYRHFNCYSYAMNENETWITVKMRDAEFSKSRGYVWDFLQDGGDINELVEIFVNKDVLVRFSEFKIISKKEIKKNTKVIAVKVSNGDYHFMKRFPNGNWFHKMGDKIIEPIKKEIVFSKEWFNKYHSKTIFLGLKEEY